MKKARLKKKGHVLFRYKELKREVFQDFSLENQCTVRNYNQI